MPRYAPQHSVSAPTTTSSLPATVPDQAEVLDLSQVTVTLITHCSLACMKILPSPLRVHQPDKVFLTKIFFFFHPIFFLFIKESIGG
jgi:hypothetical protein